ncbi:MAG TPA: hypothetical protein VJL58_01505, partial [Pyrinomonadaceae bacterium]|nr:hypothetical protein [Pyrinomonadaceae bacterium]
MTMSFLLHDHFDSTESYSPASSPSPQSPKSAFEDVHILAEKLEIPEVSGLVDRPRLTEMLERSLSQFAATLVSGRAGTGKTAMAAAFAKTRRNVVWCSIESSDVEWNVFAHYLAAGVLRGTKSKAKPDEVLLEKGDSSPNSTSLFLLNLVAE